MDFLLGLLFNIVGGVITGIIVWLLVRYGLTSFYTVDQNERAVKTIFGRAERWMVQPLMILLPNICAPKNANAIPIPKYGLFRQVAHTSSGPGNGFTRFR